MRLAGAVNVRDLGGLPTGDGRQTRFGALLRGALITPDLSDADAARLVGELGVRTVVDLRTRGEVAHHTPGWVERGVAWVHCPFRLAGFGPIPSPGADHASAYLGFLEADARPVVLAVRALMSPHQRPALFHCAAGKDRTGVLAALLLDVLGVEAAAIAADYSMSTREMPRVLSRLATVQPYRESLAGVDASDHPAEAQTMARFLSELRMRHGGAVKWLGRHGIEESLVQRFREAMLASPSHTRAGRATVGAGCQGGGSRCDRD